MGSRTYTSDSRRDDLHEIASPQGSLLYYAGRDKFVDTDMELICHRYSTSMVGDILTGRIVFPRRRTKQGDQRAIDRDPLKTKEEASNATQRAQHKFQSRSSSRRITIGASPLPDMSRSSNDSPDSMFQTPGQPHRYAGSSSSDTMAPPGAKKEL